MKAKPNEEFVPNALREVWKWKDSINQEVKHLPADQALHEIMRMAHDAAIEQEFAASAARKSANSGARSRVVRRRTKTKKMTGNTIRPKVPGFG